MTTDQIMTGFSSVSSTASTTSASNAKSSNGMSFAGIMNSNLKNKDFTQNNDTKTLSKNQVNNSTKESLQKPCTGTNQAVKQSVNASDKTSDVEQMNTSTSNDLNQTIEAAILNAASQMVEQIKDTLGLTDDELKDMLEELGMTMVDLLNPANLQQFVMNNFNTNEITDVLTNEELSSDLSLLNSSLNNILEELNSVVDFDSMDLNSVMSSVHATLQEEPAYEKPADSTVKNTDMVNTNENEVKITVEKENPTTDEQPQNDTNSNTKNYQTFIEHLNQVSNTSTDTGQIVEMKEVVQQVVDEIKVSLKADSTSMELQLNPENLGKVNLVVSSKQGVLTAHITTETVLAKEALEAGIQSLKESMETAGIKVEAIEVEVSNFEFQQSNFDNQNQQHQQHNKKSKRSISLEDLLSDNTEDSDNNEADNVILNEGSTVSYTA